MPLLAVAVVAQRRHRRPSTRVIATPVPPLWQLLVEELAVAARAATTAIRNRLIPRRT